MRLLNDIHPLTFITADLDRLMAFYERVFEARVMADLEEKVSGMPSSRWARTRSCTRSRCPVSNRREPMFQRGRLDHFGLNAASEEAFRELHRRIVAEGAGDGVVTDMGSLLNFSFTDPDGGEHEVIWVKPDVSAVRGLTR